MINFCTYFDKNYLSRFLTLAKSLDRFNISYTFYVLCLDDFVFNFFKKNYFKNIRVISLIEVENKYKSLLEAKKNRNIIEYYFTLSPFLPKYLFEKFQIAQLSYLDSDFYFFKNPIKKIKENYNFSTVLIKQYSDLKYGLYNVGWISYNFNYRETKEIVNLWSQQCIELCTDFPKNGFYADQKYLDEWSQKLKYMNVDEPECSFLSPWDKNSIIEKNFNNMLAFHFHGLRINKTYFTSGFSKYNKKNTKNIINKIYKPYLKDLISIETKYYLKNSSIRNHSKNQFKELLIKIREIKSFLKNKYYQDYYDLKILSSD